MLEVVFSTLCILFGAVYCYIVFTFIALSVSNKTITSPSYICPRYINFTDRWTDGGTTYDSNTALRPSRGKNCHYKYICNDDNSLRHRKQQKPAYHACAHAHTDKHTHAHTHTRRQLGLYLSLLVFTLQLFLECRTLGASQWRRHTRCVGCVRTPCEENT